MSVLDGLFDLNKLLFDEHLFLSPELMLNLLCRLGSPSHPRKDWSVLKDSACKVKIVVFFRAIEYF